MRADPLRWAIAQIAADPNIDAAYRRRVTGHATMQRPERKADTQARRMER